MLLIFLFLVVLLCCLLTDWYFLFLHSYEIKIKRLLVKGTLREKMHSSPLLSGVQSRNLLLLNRCTAGSTQECWLIKEHCANYQVLTRWLSSFSTACKRTGEGQFVLHPCAVTNAWLAEFMLWVSARCLDGWSSLITWIKLSTQHHQGAHSNLQPSWGRLVSWLIPNIPADIISLENVTPFVLGQTGSNSLCVHTYELYLDHTCIWIVLIVRFLLFDVIWAQHQGLKYIRDKEVCDQGEEKSERMSKENTVSCSVSSYLWAETLVSSQHCAQVPLWH